MSEQQDSSHETNAYLVEVLNSSISSDIYMAMHKLQDAGIPATPQHEAMEAVWGGNTGLLNGISLMVRAEDAPRAFEILRAAGFVPHPGEGSSSHVRGPLSYIPGKSVGAKLIFFILFIAALTLITISFAQYISR